MRVVSSTTSDDLPPSKSRMELKKIMKKIEYIVSEAHKTLQLLNLPSNSNIDKRQILATNSRGVATTVAPPRVVIGRDEECNDVITMLRATVGDNQPGCSRALPYSIIGIHGIPGSGKSTLAQYVCAHVVEDVYFDVVMWVHVSQNFTVHSILRKMIEEVTGQSVPQFEGATVLQKKLVEGLRGKLFLLVLDDVWYSKDVNHQESLKQIVSPLDVGKAGSKILATSRTLDALLSLGDDVSCIPMRDLDGDVFFKLFMHYAFDASNIEKWDQRKFEMVGADIARKLKRSPLAARLVGGQLRIRPNLEIWINAREQDLLNDTMGALWWSYQHLDEEVRRCFAYCSIFPRRHEMERNELVNLWIAEGFISSNSGEEMEAVGQGYIYELVSTSFLQPVGGAKECYTVHDLLHDLAAKERLSHVTLGWDSDGLQSCGADLQAEVLEGLRPSRYLALLQLWSYNGSKYPHWVVGVRDLMLVECSPLEAIPEHHGFSAHLLRLFIYSCNWDALPYNMELLSSLQELDIDECENLQSLPKLPQSLLRFELSNSNSQFMRSCEMGGPNWEMIKHVPTIRITPPRSE